MSKVLRRSDPRPPVSRIVEIPEWGGAVKVGALPVGLLFTAKDGPDKERDVAVQSIMSCVFDDEGQPFFSSREEIEKLDLPIFTRLQNEIAALSNPDPAAIAKN